MFLEGCRLAGSMNPALVGRERGFDRPPASGPTREQVPN